MQKSKTFFLEIVIIDVMVSGSLSWVSKNVMEPLGDDEIKLLLYVVKPINEILCFQFVTFPDLEECDHISQTFYDKYKLPFVIGCIDGTHIHVEKPSVSQS